ncbi:MAG: hypothetical protein GYB35_02240 [Algicola sp.]|nr:hypothetical protein [Algicola sp.]
MKILLLSLALILSANVFAQNTSKTPFLRVFNLEGKKIAKGKFVQVTDSTLSLRKNRKIIEISFRDIGVIKTKHSIGNNFLTGAAIGAGVLGAVLASSSTSSNNSFGLDGSLGIGALVGAPLGSAAGGAVGLFKNSKTYEIHGDEVQWHAFKDIFTQ